MQIKQGSRAHELKPNNKPSSDVKSAYHSLEKSQAAGRHTLSEIDIRGSEETRSKREIAKLRERLFQMEEENVALHKLKIQQEIELNVWMEKTRRLTEQLRGLQQESMKIGSGSDSGNEQLRKQILVLQQQSKQLASAKINVQQQLFNEREKVRTLEIQLSRLSANVEEIKELEAKYLESQSLLNKARSALDRSEGRVAKNETYISQLQAEVQYLNKQIHHELELLEQQKVAQMAQDKKKVVDQLHQTQLSLASQKTKVNELQAKVQGLTKINSRTMEELEQLRNKNTSEDERRQSLMKQLDQVQRECESLKIKNKLLKESQENRAENTLLNQSKDKELIQISELKNSLEKTQAKIKQQEIIIRQLDQQIQKMKVTIVLNNKESESLRQVNEGLRTMIFQFQTIFSQEKRQEMPLQRKLFKQEEKSPAKYHSARGSFAGHLNAESSQLAMRTEIQILQNKVKQQKFQAQQLASQLQQRNQEQLLLQEQNDKYKEEVMLLQQSRKQMARTIRDQQTMAMEMKMEIERWKSYRLSEEDEARRQARKYKKRVQELQLTLGSENSESLNALKQAQVAYEQLRMILAQKQQAHLSESDRLKNNYNKAMDQMEDQFKKLLNQCQDKLQNKQNQIESLKMQIDKLAAELGEEHLLSDQFLREKKIAEGQVQKLAQQFAYLQGEVQKCQGSSKKQSESMRSAAIAEVQRQTRMRYEKSLEQKIIQIQRLKLQNSEILQQVRKSTALRRQLEVSQASFKVLQREETEKSDRIHYLQKMIQTYEVQIRSYKATKEELVGQLRCLEQQLIKIQDQQQVIKQMERELVLERNKQAKCNEQKVRLYEDKMREQAIAKEWREKYQQLLSQKDRTLVNASTRQKQLKTQIRELESITEHKISAIQRLESQCDKLQSQLLAQSERQKLLRKQLEEEKNASQISDEKHTNLYKVIEEQKKLIQSLSLQQDQKTHQIQLLLNKLAQFENETASNSKKQVQHEQNKRASRLNSLEKLAKLSGIPLLDEEVAIKGISEWALSLSLRAVQLESQLCEYKKIILNLKEEKQNLSQKYLKYKNIALQYKERKDMQKMIIKNTYRFNEQVLTHCQNIIRGSDK